MREDAPDTSGKLNINTPDYYLVLNSVYKPVFACENLLRFLNKPFISDVGEFNTEPSVKRVAETASVNGMEENEISVSYYSGIFNRSFNFKAKADSFQATKEKFFMLKFSGREKSAPEITNSEISEKYLYDKPTALIIFTDPNFDILFTSEQVGEYFKDAGLMIQSSRIKNLSELICEQDFVDLKIKLVANQFRFEEIELKSAGTSIIKTRITASPSLTTVGSINGYFFSLHKISQVNNVLGSLKNSDRLLDAIIEGVSGHLLIIKKHFNRFVIVKANNQFYSEFNADKANITEKSIEQILPYGIAERLKKSFQKLEVNNNDYFQFEYDDVKKKQYGAKVSAVKLSEGEDVIYILSLRDLTKIVEYEKELKQAVNRQSYMSRLKSAFLQNMSHEIRTPYNSLAAYSDVIDEYFENNDFESIRGLLKSSKKVMGKVLDLFKNIVEISKIETGSLELNIVPINCKTILESVYLQRKKEVDEAGVELTYISTEEDSVIETDWVRIETLLNVLIDNALRTTHNGFIEMSIGRFDTKIQITVSDTGIGIDEDELKNLLRTDDYEYSESLSSEGIGLSLPIAMHLTRMLGGEMEVESLRNLGTKVTLIFPPASS